MGRKIRWVGVPADAMNGVPTRVTADVMNGVPTRVTADAMNGVPTGVPIRSR